MKYLAVVVLFVLVSCGGSAEAQVLSPESHYQIEDIMVDGNEWPQGYRLIDTEAGVVCYQTTTAQGGFNCLPLSETKLDTEEQ